MASFLDKLNQAWSGLDFWDEEENRKQRERFKKEEEEEEKRRRQQVSQTKPQFRPGSVIDPNKKDFDMSKPLVKAASQSQYQNLDTPQYLQKTGSQRKADEAETVDKPKGFWEKAGKVAQLSTGRVATGLAQGVGGMYDILTPGKGSNRLTDLANETAEDLDEAAKRNDVETAYKVTNVPFEIASYLIPSKGISTLGKGLSKLPAVGKGLAKAPQYADDIIKNVSGKSKFAGDAVEELLDPQNLKKELQLTNRYLGQDSAQGEEITPQRIAADAALAGAGALSVPALRKAGRFLRKTFSGTDEAVEQADEVVEEGVKKFDEAEQARKEEFKNAQKEEAPDIPGKSTSDTVADESVEVEQGIKSTNLVKQSDEALQQTQLDFGNQNIPSPDDPIALQKAENVVGEPTPQNDTPMANFNEAQDGSLQKAETPKQFTQEVAQEPRSEGRAVQTGMTPEGNVAPVTQEQRVRELVDEGLVPARGDSVVGQSEDAMSQAREQAAKEQVQVSEDAAARRVRQELVDQAENETLKADLAENFDSRKNPLNLEEVENTARAEVNNMSDAQLINNYQEVPSLNDPTDMFRANLAYKRLRSAGTPEANRAAKNIVDGLTRYAEESGQRLRSVAALYENLPTEMKQELLIDKLNKAGAKLDEGTRTELLARIEAADMATETLEQLKREAEEILDSGVINNENVPEEVLERVAQLSNDIQEAQRAKEEIAGEAWKFFQDTLRGTGSVGKRVADVGRTMMLGSLSGRVFDLISTSLTSTDDLINKGVSNLLGKIVNKVKGAGTVQDTLPSIRNLWRGTREGAERTKGSFQGKDYVEDFMGQAKRATRGDIDNGGGKVRQFVRSAVETPTNMTRGLREDQLYREGMQEAAEQGLEGQARQAYAELRSVVPSKEQLHEAVQTHMRANMLHENGISRTFNSLANRLDKSFNGMGAPFIRNQVIPFTSWIGGNFHRTLTDKNILYNAASAVSNARKGNVQGLVDDISKFGVNSAEAFGLGYLLTENGVLTDTDANGDDYGGLYLHIGDRYIPVAATGMFSAPLIWGNSMHSAVDAAEVGDKNPAEAFVDNLGEKTLKNAGIASVFGGENNLVRTTEQLLRGDASGAFTRYSGNTIRQFIPGITGDFNSVLDQSEQLNPTGEAPETIVKRENPATGREVTAPFQTEVNRTKARIPFLSQSLPRRDDVTAKDPLDRVLKSTQESPEIAELRAGERSLEDLEREYVANDIPLQSEDIETAIEDGEFEKAIKGREFQLQETKLDPDSSKEDIQRAEDRLTEAQLRSEGVSITDTGIQARIEQGEYDKAVRGLQFDLAQKERDRDVPESNKQEIRDEIEKLKVVDELNYSPQTYTAYNNGTKSTGGIGVTAWRDMVNSGDPAQKELANKLYTLDQALLEAGIIDEPKYYWKKGGGSGSGSGGVNVPNFATQNIPSYTFQPLKAQPAKRSGRESAIPQLEKVPDYDRSKLRKIKVTKGGRP